MFYSLQGTLDYFDANIAVVNCGGVGFRCRITVNTARKLPPVGQGVFLYTHLNVREDALELFGFAEQSELACFKQLTTVSGVGAKVAGAILSALTPDQVATAIATGDYKKFTLASGVGPKMAQRIALELKDKVAAFTDGTPLPASVVSASANAEAAVKALTTMFGFQTGEASALVAKLDSELSVDEMVAAALKQHAKEMR